MDLLLKAQEIEYQVKMLGIQLSILPPVNQVNYNTRGWVEEQEKQVQQLSSLLEEYKDLIIPVLNTNQPPIPMEGMPWNIPGGLHSPEAVPASTYVDREMIHQMTCREDLLSQED
ncbi:hypothetical protein Q5H92_14735 [Hymenobacter sp. M29]|uniref:Uncharacterized protein n=1 Tax=Hymenobacter mellowenesis TaxID=3063995 RepID=A0ABT9ADY1_9BACT|nr:hypothetical protein [Hymenobacter sp. M29]MDO7847622.1 hypothetical protein [Hymenobacter sp. M29]